jgi:endonuclease III
MKITINPDDKEAQTKRMKSIIKILSKEYPVAKIQLEFNNPFELLVATVLSAQCTDNRVNIVTAQLFKKYKTIQDFINVSTEELEKDIFSTGFYKAKARYIKQLSEELLSNYNGIVPNTMDELLKLSGVGRKTANVILGHCFNTPGIVVDTHVIRIANRLGFASTENAEKIEMILMDIVPKKQWVVFTHYLINFGRNTCIARKPKCNECNIESLCPSSSK